MIACAGITVGKNQSKKSETVAWINDIPVSMREIELFAEDSADVADIVHTLQVGAVRRLVVLDRQYLIFFCEDRKEEKRKEFEECRDVLREMYQEEYQKAEKEKECSYAKIVYSELLKK